MSGTIDECLWEIGHAFATYKLTQINAFIIKTNEDGNKMSVIFYKFGESSYETIQLILNSFDAFLHFYDETNSWKEVNNSVAVVDIAEASGIYLKKYTFTAETDSDLKLAGKNVHKITSITHDVL